MTLVPSRDGDGTNAMLFDPLDALAPSFGPGSFARHLAQAAARGIACRTLPLPGIGLDIDEPDDLAQLMRPHAPTRATPSSRSAVCRQPERAAMSTATELLARLPPPRPAAASRASRPWLLPTATTSPASPRWPSSSASPATAHRDLLQEGVHPADAPVPRRVPLLHLRPRPDDREPHYLSPDAVLAIARAGQAAGCKEALFTLGDQPERRYAAAREALAALGADSTLAYLEVVAPPWCCARPACCRISIPA